MYYIHVNDTRYNDGLIHYRKFGTSYKDWNEVYTDNADQIKRYCQENLKNDDEAYSINPHIYVASEKELSLIMLMI